MNLSPAISPDGGTDGLKYRQFGETYLNMPYFYGTGHGHVVKVPGIFNKLTLAGLYDIKSLKTSGRRACQNGKLIPLF